MNFIIITYSGFHSIFNFYLFNLFKLGLKKQSQTVYKENILINNAPISILTERVSKCGILLIPKTEASTLTGPESRVTGRETPILPAASRRWIPPSLRPQHGLTQEAKNDQIFRKVKSILKLQNTVTHYTKASHNCYQWP